MKRRRSMNLNRTRRMTVTHLEHRLGRVLLALFGTVMLGLSDVRPVRGDPPVLERVKKIQLSGQAEKHVDHMALDTKRDRLLVGNLANSTLDIIDLKEGKLLKSVPDQ